MKCTLLSVLVGAGLCLTGAHARAQTLPPAAGAPAPRPAAPSSAAGPHSVAPPTAAPNTTTTAATPATAAGAAATPPASGPAGPATPSSPPTAAANVSSANTGFGLIDPATPEADPNAVEHSSFEGDPWGDEGGGPATFGPLSFRVLLQPRYEQTFAESSRSPRFGYAVREDYLATDGDGFSLQRLFFRVAAAPTPMLEFKAILDFAKLRGSDVGNVLKQAYATLKPIPKHVEIAAGIFKLPYSILELDPVARYELTDLGDADNLIKNLGFAGRDVGVEVMVAPLSKPRHLRFMLGTFRGHAKDEHASPLGAIGGRIESKPFKWLRLGAGVVGMPSSQRYKQPFETSSKEILPNPPDPLYPREQRWGSGKAYSADITFSRKRLMLRLEGMLGDRVDIDTRYGARSFIGGWALAAYRFWVGPIRLMPAARVEWLDTDREHSIGVRRSITCGVNVLFSKTLRFVVDVTRTDVEGGTPVIEQPQPLAAVPYLDLDNTRVTAQLQLEI